MSSNLNSSASSSYAGSLPELLPQSIFSGTSSSIVSVSSTPGLSVNVNVTSVPVGSTAACESDPKQTGMFCSFFFFGLV